MKWSYRWIVIVELKVGFNPISISLFHSSSLKDAFDYLESRQHLNNKKRRHYLKELGKKERYTVDYSPFVYDEDTEDTAEQLAKAHLQPGDSVLDWWDGGLG